MKAAGPRTDGPPGRPRQGDRGHRRHLHRIFIERPRSGSPARRSLEHGLPGDAGQRWAVRGTAQRRCQLMEEHMFVAIARFPEVPADREDEFEAWFAWSNSELRPIDGLTGRRLLRAADGTYAAVVEHASPETFAAMHATEVATQVRARLNDILNDQPRSTKYEVVADLAAAEGCCGGKGRQQEDACQHGGELVDAAGTGGCHHDS